MADPDPTEREEPPRKRRKVEAFQPLDPASIEDPKSGWPKNIHPKGAALARMGDNVYWIDMRNKLKMGKFNGRTTPLKDTPLGGFWRWQGKKPVPAPAPVQKLETTGAVEEQKSIVSANQDKWDENDDAQAVRKEDIEAMRERGLDGDQVVQEIVKGAKNWDKKNIYQKEKYKSKKKKKHVPEFQVLRCNGYNLAWSHFKKKGRKVMNLRPDTVSQLLAVGNVCAGNKVLMVDDCAGLIAAAACERMGGYGKLYHGVHPGKEGLQCLHNFLKPTMFVKRTVVNFNLDIIPHLQEDRAEDSEQNPFAMRKPFLRPTVAEVKADLRLGCDSLILASAYHPLSLLKFMLPLLKTGSVFCIYAEFIEPLTEIYQWSKGEEGSELCFNVRIWENWYRAHQVLPGRTHPTVRMSATGGYLLSGYKLSSMKVQSEGKRKQVKTNTDTEEELQSK